jgi:hypothetical protein
MAVLLMMVATPIQEAGAGLAGLHNSAQAGVVFNARCRSLLAGKLQTPPPSFGTPIAVELTALLKCASKSVLKNTDRQFHNQYQESIGQMH